MRRCKKCGKHLAKSAHFNKKYCRVCIKDRRRKTQRTANRKWRKNLTEPLMRKQKSLCAICKQKLKHPYRDHNRSCCLNPPGCSKCRRGILCPDCNTKLAALEKPGWVTKAKKYLKKWGRAQ